MATAFRLELEPVEGAPHGTFAVKRSTVVISSHNQKPLTREEIVVAAAFYYKHYGRTPNFNKGMLHYMVGFESALGKRLVSREFHPHVVKSAIRNLMREYGILGDTTLFFDITVFKPLSTSIARALILYPHSEWVLRAYYGPEAVALNQQYLLP